MASTSVRRCDRFAIARAVLTVLVIGSVLADAIGAARLEYDRSLKVRLAQDTVNEYASEAYAMWATEHPEHPCPRDLAELNAYMNNTDIIDPWGGTYQLRCDGDPHHLAVSSPGEDRIPGTADDLRSN